MNNASSILFDSTILPPSDAAQPAAATPRPAPANAQPMPSSLWRHTLQEHSRDAGHRVAQRIAFAVIAVLSLGSVAYAAWQTCSLMAGNSLHDAIAALMR